MNTDPKKQDVVIKDEVPRKIFPFVFYLLKVIKSKKNIGLFRFGFYF